MTSQALFCKWVKSRVRASPYAAWTSIQVAGEAMAAAMSQDAPGWSGNKSGE
jgi:hypothetical protein